MKRNIVYLATSLLVVSSALVEVQAHNQGGHSDGYQQTSDQNNNFFRPMKRERKVRRRGGWYRLFRASGNGGASSEMMWPTADADSTTTTMDTATTIDLLANDTGTGLKLKNLFTNTQAGGAVTSSAGGVTYTPPAGFAGIDEFWYVVTDSRGRSSAARVTVDVSGTNLTAAADETNQGFTIPEAVNQDPLNPEAISPEFINQAPINGLEGLANTPTGETTAGVKCDYAEDTYNGSESIAANSEAEWSCSESERLLTANGLPEHEVGTFPSEANPNTITEQTVSKTFPLTPTKAETMSTPDVIAYALNGVKIDAVTSGSCNFTGDECSTTDNSGFWSIEALEQDHFDFGSDDNNGYVQADGAYTYHGLPNGFLKNQGASDAVMTLIGWAADGFPVYGLHGHSVADDVDSDLKEMTGSYKQVENTDDSRPSTTTYELGTFTQDWQYVEGSGDLDECNGRTGVTPEFPDGIYHYFATKTFPFVPRCVKGVIEEAGDGVNIPDFTPVPELTETPGVTETPDFPVNPALTEENPEVGTQPETTEIPDFVGTPPPTTDIASAEGMK